MKPILALFATLGLAAAAEAPPAVFFPPGTKVVFGIRVRNLAETAFFQDAGSDIRTSATTMLAQTPLAGLDPSKDIDEVLLASSAGGDKAPAIAVIHGRFHLVVQPEARRYQDVPLLEDPQHPEGIVALIDDSTLIAGAPADVRAAIDRLHAGAASTLPETWITRIQALRDRYTIWGFGEGLEPAPPATPVAAKPGDLSTIDNFQFGASFDQGLRITAEAHLQTARDAEQLRSMLQLFQGMMLAQAPGQKKSPNGSSFDLRVEKSALKLAVFLPEAELKKAMREQQATLAKAFTSGLSLGMSGNPTATASSAAKAVVIRSSEGKVYTDERGDTVSVTLPVIKK